MSDSGRQAGDCQHMRQAEWCVDCLRAECERLRSAIATHHSQKADDRCIEDDDEDENTCPQCGRPDHDHR